MSELSDTEKCDKLELAFEAERTTIGSDIQTLVQESKELTKIPEVQAYMLSYRQIYSEKTAKYRSGLNKRREADLYHKSLRLRQIREGTSTTLNQNFTYTDRQIDQLITSEMAGRTRMLMSTESQIQFLEEMIDLLDKLGFAIKNRIEYEKLVMP